MASKNDITSIVEASELLKTMSNPSRLAILCCIREQEMSVGELAEFLDLGQSALSQHLARLRDQGLVQTRREQQMIFYSLSSPEVVQLIKVLRKMYCDG